MVLWCSCVVALLCGCVVVLLKRCVLSLQVIVRSLLFCVSFVLLCDCVGVLLCCKGGVSLITRSHLVVYGVVLLLCCCVVVLLRCWGYACLGGTY